MSSELHNGPPVRPVGPGFDNDDPRLTPVGTLKSEGRSPPPAAGRMVPRRYICAVLDQMRKCDETKSYAHLVSLIEEGQMYADRMESALEASEELCRGIVKIIDDENSGHSTKIGQISRLVRKVFDPDLPTIGRSW